MATFDQLPAEQRAIIELVVQRGRSYAELSDMLGMPEPRIRELARTALADLSPVTAGRVDPDWRGQLGDYLLGQQSGPESTATQGHLKRSEPARAYALSLLDSLDTLFENGNRPEVPEAAAERARERTRPRERERTRELPARPLRAAAGGPLSPAAEAAVRKRRIIGAALAGLVALALVWLIFLRGGDDDDTERAGNGDTTEQQAQEGAGQAQLIGQLELEPVDGAEASGFAFIGANGNEPVLIVQGKVPPVEENEAYQVWLYNSRGDVRSLGAQQPDENGNFEGTGPLPEGFDRYKYIDISRESVEEADEEHSGQSVLRGEIANAQPVQGGPGGGAGGQGGEQQPPQP